MRRYDIIYYGNMKMRIEPHFCREWDDEHGGCYGTNPRHGMSLVRAWAHKIKWMKGRLEYRLKSNEATE